MQWTLKNQSKQEKINTLENTITQLVNIANGRVAFINKNKELYEKKAGLEKKIIKNKKNFDIMFKPGLYEMISSFNKGNYLNFCSIKDQIKLIKLCNRIAGY